MYINSVDINNIRSIKELRLEFEAGRQAGWHVLIGENGSGKTSILRCIAMGLMGEKDLAALRIDSRQYAGNFSNPKSIFLGLRRDTRYDVVENFEKKVEWMFRGFGGKPVLDELKKREEAIERLKSSDLILSFWGIFDTGSSAGKFSPAESVIEESTGDEQIASAMVFDSKTTGFFSAAFGPFRRFRGGNDSWDEVYDSNPRAAAHMSLFGEDVAFTQIEPWLIKLEHKRLRNENGHVLKFIKILLNERQLLPDKTKLKEITPDGLVFEDANGVEISIHQLSDGFRSVLSLTLELLRQLIRVYGEEKTFENLEKQIKEGKTDEKAINNLPGVVLIDEIDAHLHPTWQTKIGQWFRDYFPKLQFIVTTHSPLVCRACGDDGSIWHLRGPGSDESSRKLEGVERDRLVFGDILDAYDTNLFGEDIERGEEGIAKRERYRELSYKKRYGVEMEADELEELANLNEIFRFNVEGTRSRVK